MSFLPKILPRSLRAYTLAFFLAWQPTNMAWAAGESIVETIRALIEKGNALLSHGSYEQAIEEYEKVLEKEPNNPYAKSNIVLAHNNWGIAYFHQGKLEQAKKEWDTALKLNPNDHNAHNNIAVLKNALAKQGKTLDDIDTEKKEKAEAAKKEQEKKAAEAPPSAVVILSGSQKQPTSENSSDASASGAQIVTPPLNNTSSTNSSSGATILSGSTSSPPANSATSSGASIIQNKNVDKGAIQTYGQQGWSKEEPAQAENAVPAVPKTKAQEELDAFKRLTSTSEKAAGEQSAPPVESIRKSVPMIGAPLVFHSSGRVQTDSGEAADFMDDKLSGPSASATRPSSQNIPQAVPQSVPQTPPTVQKENPPPNYGTTESAQQTPSDNEETKPSRHRHNKSRQVAEASEQPVDAPISPNSIDGVLNRLEVKIYGQSTNESSVIKRLEHMETDSFGRPSVGAISARLTRLKKMYNVSD